MIVGISGKAGSGKDTFANILMEVWPCQHRLFAGVLKEMAEMLTGVPLGDQYSNKSLYLEQWGMTIGQFQQKLGTDAVRNGLHQDAWVIALMTKYDKCPGQKWVITDVRFPNEANAIKARGGILVRINRKNRPTDGRDPNHISETSLDDYCNWDFVINNDGAISDLYSKALEIRNKIERQNVQE